jgi:hypothetical protein
MKILVDQRKVARRAAFANIGSVGGMLLLLGGVLLSLLKPDLSSLSSFFMIGGLFFAMVGIYLANRWVRKPRPEHSLEKALKGLNDSFRLYHYPALVCDHVLLAPQAVYVLYVINLNGSFIYKEGRWRERMSLGRALRYIVEEHVGDPAKLAREYALSLEATLYQAAGSEMVIPVKPVVIFSHPGVHLDLEEKPQTPVCKIDHLRKLISAKSSPFPLEVYERIKQFMDQKTIQ